MKRQRTRWLSFLLALTMVLAMLPPVPAFAAESAGADSFTDLMHIICYGQSFSVGADAPGYADPIVDGTYVLGSITGSTAGDKLLPLQMTSGAQHPIVTAVNSMSRMLNADGIDTDIIAGSYGSGGRTIAQLMSAERQAQIKEEEGYPYDIQSSGRYMVFQTSVATVADYAEGTGQSVSCPAIVFLQGETDQNTDAQLGYPENPARAGYGAGGDKETYKQYMARLKEDMQREVMEAYGQTEKPLFLIYQVSGTYVRTPYSSINMAQLEFAQENEDVILIQTPYFTPHYTNSHHLTVNGYRWLGEYIGQSMYTALTKQEKTWPLLPREFTVADGRTLRITVSGAENGLTIDTWTVEDATNGGNRYGFYFEMDGAKVVPETVAVDGDDIVLTLPDSAPSFDYAQSIYVFYGGQKAKGTGNIRDNSPKTGFYRYLDDSADTGTGKNQGVSHSALDKNGDSLIGQPYPLYNWLASFCYQIPGAAQKEGATYRWEMQENGLVSIADAHTNENPLTLTQGSVENGILKKVQYEMEKTAALYHDRPWFIEWKAAGNGSSYGGGMLLAASDGSGSKAGGLYVPADSRGMVAWNVSSEGRNYGIKLGTEGIDTRAEHTYRIENRIAADGTNTVWLIVDGTEIGEMNTSFSTSNGSQNDDITNWANGANIYLRYMGKPTSFLLNNMKLSYLTISEGNHEHRYQASVTAPTCTEQGYTTYTCACGDSYVDSYVDAFGHSYANGICTICGAYQVRWEIGTIASATGQNNNNDSRFRTVEYLELTDYSGMSIGKGYTATNFVYDENYSYLGTSSWLGEGIPFTTAELQEKYPAGVYFRAVFRAMDQRTLTEEDIVSSGVKFYLPGEDVPAPDLGFDFENIGSIGSWQDGSVWDGKLFVLGAAGSGAVFDAKTGTKLGNLSLDGKEVLKPHANSVCFGSTYYAEGDPYPLLYVNIYNNYATAEDRMEGTCCVYRITESEGGYKTELVQIIKIGFVDDLTLWKSKENNTDARPYGNFVVDTDNHQLYAFVMRDADRTTRFFRFDIPDLHAGRYNEIYGCNVVTLETEDINAQFDIEHYQYLQGCCYSSGFILYMGDFGGDAPLCLVDLESQTLKEIVCLGYAGLRAEPEVLCVNPEDGTLYYAAADGVLRTIALKNTHLHVYQSSTKAPTCTEQGCTTYTCACGESYVSDYQEATGHSYDPWSITVIPTCTEPGMERRDCKNCGHYETREVAATGHRFGEWKVTAAPTCTKPGQERRDCKDCEHYETRPVAATGHDYGSVVTPPTCTERGYTTHTCACGDSFVDSWVDATGHCFGEWKVITSPTCTKPGQERRDCENCDHYETRELAATGHDYKSVVTEPTCTEKGFTTHTCVCGDSYVDAWVDALGHRFGEWKVTAAPTCTKPGQERRDCENCNHHETREIAATGHSYESVVTEPTCTEKGFTTHTCACGESFVDSWVDATGHSWGEWEVIQEPTATAPGLRQRICGNCGEAEQEEIPQLEIIYGDANGDGRVNSLDVIILRQYLADWDVEPDMAAADANGDGRINSLDVILLRQYLADWDVTLGPQ